MCVLIIPVDAPSVLITHCCDILKCTQTPNHLDYTGRDSLCVFVVHYCTGAKQCSAHVCAQCYKCGLSIGQNTDHVDFVLRFMVKCSVNYQTKHETKRVNSTVECIEILKLLNG